MTVAARASDNLWDAYARSLVNCVRPIITWARCETGVPVGDGPHSAMLSLQALTDVVQDRKLPLPMPDGQVGLVDLTAAPAELFAPLLGYLAQLPCYDPCRTTGVDQPEQAQTQHSYVLMHVSSVMAASPP